MLNHRQKNATRSAMIIGLLFLSVTLSGCTIQPVADNDNRGVTVTTGTHF